MIRIFFLEILYLFCMFFVFGIIGYGKTGRSKFDHCENLQNLVFYHSGSLIVMAIFVLPIKCTADYHEFRKQLRRRHHFIDPTSSTPLVSPQSDDSNSDYDDACQIRYLCGFVRFIFWSLYIILLVVAMVGTDEITAENSKNCKFLTRYIWNYIVMNFIHIFCRVFVLCFNATVSDSGDSSGNHGKSSLV